MEKQKQKEIGLRPDLIVFDEYPSQCKERGCMNDALKGKEYCRKHLDDHWLIAYKAGDTNAVPTPKVRKVVE